MLSSNFFAKSCFFRNATGALLLLAFVWVFLAVMSLAVSAQTLTTIHQFGAVAGDGASPSGGLVSDGAGNYYGVTLTGVTRNQGTVFQLTAPAIPGGTWTETILWNFGGPNDGLYPEGGLVRDKRGNLYGETGSGGSASCYCGIVFKLKPPTAQGGAWTERVMHRFAGGNDGYAPAHGLTLDSAGNVYGVSVFGGVYGCGIAFKIASVGSGFAETIIYSFGSSSADPMFPSGPLLLASNGVMFGVAYSGGVSQIGAVYTLTPPASGAGTWTRSTLYSFPGGDAGCDPEGNLVKDVSGNIYGIAAYSCSISAGVFFRLAPPVGGSTMWTESVLYPFGSNESGSMPSLYLDTKSSTFYGTLQSGGALSGGEIIKIAPPAIAGGVWSETVLYNFDGLSGSSDVNPGGPLVQDANGLLYGLTGFGGAGGSAFSITPR